MRNILLVALLAIASSAVSFATDEIPKSAAFARYQVMLDRSPFAVATAVAAPASAPFAKDLYIANAAHSPDGDLVTLASSADKNFKKYLTTTAPVDGYSISSIEWSEKVGATRVTIAKEGQFATLTFNQALLSQPLANASSPAGPPPPQQPPVLAPQPMPGQSGIVLPNIGNVQPGAMASPYTIKPMPVPSLPTPPPRVRGVIPRNLTSPAPNQSQQPEPE
ncbi:MAG: hypothetical protein ACR2MF_10410 [Chthoniobacterales bacterium]